MLWGLFFGTPKLEPEHRFARLGPFWAILRGLKLEFCVSEISFFECEQRFFNEIHAFGPIWPLNSIKKLHFDSQNTGFQCFRKLQNAVFDGVPSILFLPNRSQMQGNRVFRLRK